MDTHGQRLQIFVPEGNRPSDAIPVDLQDRWTTRLLTLCGRLFGGATAYGRGVGVWAEGHGARARMHWDRVTVVEAWIDPALPGQDAAMSRLARTMKRMRLDLRQEEVLYIFNGRTYSFRKSGRRKTRGETTR